VQPFLYLLCLKDVKLFLTILCFLSFSSVFAQGNAAKLAEQLTSSRKTELEKVTAIFRWITDNIAYKPKRIGKAPVIGTYSMIFFENKVEIDDSQFNSLDERVAEMVLLTKQTVCDGYARLFHVLCKYAGIQTEIITGYARSTLNKPVENFGVNHCWNAVSINGNWHLLDVTWASGYISSKTNEFVKDYDEKYFLTTPEVFLNDHYPDDVRWTLLPYTKVPEEFRHSPFKQKSFAKYEISSFYPATGVIEAVEGDTIRLQVQITAAEKKRNIGAGFLPDSSILSQSSLVFLRPRESKLSANNNQYNYFYKATSPDVEWLYLLYNDDMILRYKVNVKKKDN